MSELTRREINTITAKLRYAVKTGRVIKLVNCAKCGIFSAKLEAHHPDYSKPFDVVWLCSSCHKAIHYKPKSLFPVGEEKKIVFANIISKSPVCLRCGHSWMARTRKPKHCPKCKSRIWEKP